MIKTNAQDIPMSKIVQSTNFSRSVYDKAAMDSLSKSITNMGLLHPVGVSPSKEHSGKYDLVYGYRRFKAYMELNKTNIPAIILSEVPLSQDERMKLNVAENGERKDVTLMESGLRWLRMIDHGDYTVKEISYMEGVNEKKIDSVISIYKMIPQKYIKNIVANDDRADQSFILTQSKVHAVMTASKYEGMSTHVENMFELIRKANANEKEILEVRKLIQAGYTPEESLRMCRRTNSKIMSKALTFKVQKKKWNDFKDQYGKDVTIVLSDALKRVDKKIINDFVAMLG